MGDAAKVIEWNGTDVPADIRDVLAGLPPGRYRLEVVPAAEDEVALTPEGEAEIEAAMRQMDAGQGIPLAEVDAQLRKIIAESRAR
jgi:hypothetical protein